MRKDSCHTRSKWRDNAPALLLHLNLLLVVYAGAGLATAARLKWDPSTYVPLRELFPLEYRVAAVTLCAAAATLLALAHLAVCALSLASAARTAARCLLLTYAVLMTMLMCVELVWVGWSCARIVSWLHSERGVQVVAVIRAAYKLESSLHRALNFLTRIKLVPDDVVQLLNEMEADVPRNLYVCVGAVSVACVLQPAAAALAVLCAAAAAPPPTTCSFAVKIDEAKDRKTPEAPKKLATLMKWPSTAVKRPTMPVESPKKPVDRPEAVSTSTPNVKHFIKACEAR